MSPQSAPFTELRNLDASSIPRPRAPDYQQHFDDLIAEALKVIDTVPDWKSKGKYHHMVDVRERTDWRGKRNWFVRRSIHKDLSLEAFRVFPAAVNEG
jgi:hypothetical protein